MVPKFPAGTTDHYLHAAYCYAVTYNADGTVFKKTSKQENIGISYYNYLDLDEMTWEVAERADFELRLDTDVSFVEIKTTKNSIAELYK